MKRLTALTVMLVLCFWQTTHLLAGHCNLYQCQNHRAYKKSSSCCKKTACIHHKQLAIACAHACEQASLQALLCKDSHGIRYADMYYKCAKACDKSAQACKSYVLACKNYHHMNNDQTRTALEQASMRCMQNCRITKKHCMHARDICMNNDCSAGVKIFNHCIKTCRLMIRKHKHTKLYKSHTE